MGTNHRLSQGDFQKRLAFGQIAETEISRWLISRGNHVLPIYDIEYETGKGPRIFGGDTQIVAPDLIVISRNGACWIEAKHKSVFTWHRITSAWTTGIDLHHYKHYLRAAKLIAWPVWLLFLHRSSQPDARDRQYRCPDECPVGLFGNTIDILQSSENHRHANWGRYGMVYWSVQSLRLLASIDEINDLHDGFFEVREKR